MIPSDIQNRQVENYPETHHRVLPEQMQEGLKYHFGQQVKFKSKCFPIDPPFFHFFLENAHAVLLWKRPVCLRAWKGALI